MTNFEKETIMDFALGKINKEIFLMRMDLEESTIQDYTLKSLEKGCRERDRDTIEFTLYFGYDIACSKNFIDVLNDLIIEDWHICHEDIARLLQLLKSPKSISYLYKAIFVAPQLEYLPGYLSGPLIRKCCFALGDINTFEARQILQELSKSDNELISEAAHEQIGIHRIETN